MGVPVAWDAVDVPQTLHGLLLSRRSAARHGPSRAQEAAVLGAQFDRELLAAIATEASTSRRRSTPVAAGLVQTVGGGQEGDRYRFTHALAHEVAHQNLLRRARRLHERTGRAIERARAKTAAAERSRSARPSLEPLARQGQGRTPPARGRRLGAQRLCQRRRDPPLRARPAHARALHRLRRLDACRARAAR